MALQMNKDYESKAKKLANEAEAKRFSNQVEAKWT
jgi:hypothetical protein